MKNKGLIITLIVVLGFFALAITGLFVYFLVKGNNFNFSFNFKGTNMKLVEKYEHELTDIDKIYFNLLSTDVEIKESLNEKLLVEYHSNQEKNAKIEYKDKTIIVDESNYNLSCFGFCNVKRKIVLYIPTSYTNGIEIKTKSGDIKSDLDLVNDFNISTVSGDISLKGVNNINISTTSGDILLDKVSNKMSFKTVSGDILIHNLDIKENSNIKTVSGDIIVTNNECNCYIDFSTVSGDQLIRKSDRKSDIILNVNTVSGDIGVN